MTDQKEPLEDPIIYQHKNWMEQINLELDLRYYAFMYVGYKIEYDQLKATNQDSLEIKYELARYQQKYKKNQRLYCEWYQIEDKDEYDFLNLMSDENSNNSVLPIGFTSVRFFCLKLANYLHLNLVDGSSNNFQLNNVEVFNEISNIDLLRYLGNKKDTKLNSRQNYMHIIYDFISDGIIHNIGLDNILNYQPQLCNSILIYNIPSYITKKDIESVFSDFPVRVKTSSIKVEKVFNYDSFSHFYITFENDWELNYRCVQHALEKNKTLIKGDTLGDFRSEYTHVSNPLDRSYIINVDYGFPLTMDSFFKYTCDFNQMPKYPNDPSFQHNQNTKLNTILDDYVNFKTGNFKCFYEFTIYKLMNDFDSKKELYDYLRNPCKLKCQDIDDLPDYNSTYKAYSKYDFITWYGSDHQWNCSLNNESDFESYSVDSEISEVDNQIDLYGSNDSINNYEFYHDSDHESYSADSEIFEGDNQLDHCCISNKLDNFLNYNDNESISVKNDTKDYYKDYPYSKTSDKSVNQSMINESENIKIESDYDYKLEDNMKTIDEYYETNRGIYNLKSYSKDTGGNLRNLDKELTKLCKNLKKKQSKKNWDKLSNKLLQHNTNSNKLSYNEKFFSPKLDTKSEISESIYNLKLKEDYFSNKR